MITGTAPLTAEPVPAASRRRVAVSRAQRRRMWAVGIVIVGAIGFLVYKGLTSAIVFFKTANEAVAQRAQLGNSDFQLEGTVVSGTVHHVNGDVYRFVVESSGVSVAVENTGYPPQMFRPGLPVVVVGHFVGSSNLFASDQIMVKHSQAYIAAHPGRVKPAAGSSP
ncbi:MAG TPA: cytochrome c maturation protein CcmE [Acidimicrobiales bacterium]|nr:cytochrome c maturation protein CcmE [Acidimicrobiales bacterium]